MRSLLLLPVVIERLPRLPRSTFVRSLLLLVVVDHGFDAVGFVSLLLLLVVVESLPRLRCSGSRDFRVAGRMASLNFERCFVNTSPTPRQLRSHNDLMRDVGTMQFTTLHLLLVM